MFIQTTIVTFLYVTFMQQNICQQIMSFLFRLYLAIQPSSFKIIANKKT